MNIVNEKALEDELHAYARIIKTAEASANAVRMVRNDPAFKKLSSVTREEIEAIIAAIE